MGFLFVDEKRIKKRENPRRHHKECTVFGRALLRVTLNGKLLKHNGRIVVFKSCHILILVIFILFTNEAAFSKAMTLKFASIGPNKGYIGDAEQLFFDEIEKQTNGKLLIQRSSNYIFKPNAIFDAVRSGRAELAALNIAYYPKRLILNSAIYLFQRGPTHYNNIMWVYDQIYKEFPVLNNELKQFNQKTIYRFANLPTAVFFNKPVNSVDDFKGKRIRCTSRWDIEILKGIGAIPITSSIENLYTALKTNAIEGLMTSVSAPLIQSKEVTQYVFISRELWTPRPLQITINLDTWNHLPNEIKKGIEIAAINAREKMAENYLNWFEISIAEHKKMGRTIVFASKEDISTWIQQAEAKHVLTQWQTEAKDAGYQDAYFLLSRIQKVINVGIDREKM